MDPFKAKTNQATTLQRSGPDDIRLRKGRSITVYDEFGLSAVASVTVAGEEKFGTLPVSHYCRA